MKKLIKKKNIFSKKSKELKKTLTQLTQLMEEKGIEGGGQQIGNKYIYWRIIENCQRCPTCKRCSR